MRRQALLLRGEQWVRVIATAGCVLAGGVGVASCGVGRQLPPVVIGGVTAPTGGTEPLTRALVSSDGLHVTVPVSSSNMSCRDLALTADGKGARVLLHASATPGTGIGAGCAHDAATTENLTATLRTPLRGRALADGATGQPVPYFDGRQLYSVGDPPTGYRLYANTPWLDPWVIAQPKSPQGYTAWVREYVPPGACPVDSVNVQVSQFKPASAAAGLGNGPGPAQDAGRRASRRGPGGNGERPRVAGVGHMDRRGLRVRRGMVRDRFGAVPASPAAGVRRAASGRRVAAPVSWRARNLTA